MTPTGRAAFDPSGREVLAFTRNALAEGRRVAIVSLAAIEGSSPRGIGAQMAIRDDGCFAGAISSGCLEQAVVDEARAALERERGGVIRYGAGSPFKDLILPCGSGLDLLYTVDPDASIVEYALRRLDRREAVTLRFTPSAVGLTDEAHTEFNDEILVRRYEPPLRVAAAGIGVELVQLARIGAAAGYAIAALSPDQQTLARSAAKEQYRLAANGLPNGFFVDPWTAFVLMFHDREWERALAPAALSSSAFYIGAVGSRRTAAARRRLLLEDGVEDAAIAKLRGPIGLAPATRNPSALALSILAEIANAWADRWER